MQDYYLSGMVADGSCDGEQLTEITQWLHVSGDLDDFIYYGEEPFHSER